MRLTVTMVAPGFLAWIDSRRAQLACEIVVSSCSCHRALLATSNVSVFGMEAQTSLDAAAKAAFAAGRYEEAAALFGQLLINGAPDSHLVLCNRSAAWAKLGKWAEAEGDARVAMASSPSSFVKAPYRLACALQGGGRLDEAQAICRAALEQAPGSEQLLGLLHSCTPPPDSVAATKPDADASASTEGGGLGLLGGLGQAGSAASNLVSAAAWEEGAAEALSALTRTCPEHCTVRMGYAYLPHACCTY